MIWKENSPQERQSLNFFRGSSSSDLKERARVTTMRTETLHSGPASRGSPCPSRGSTRGCQTSWRRSRPRARQSEVRSPTSDWSSRSRVRSKQSCCRILQRILQVWNNFAESRVESFLGELSWLWTTTLSVTSFQILHHHESPAGASGPVDCELAESGRGNILHKMRKKLF